MTKQQATALKEQIATEMPIIEAEPLRKGSTWWILKLKHPGLRRELSILHINEWQGVKEAWQK